MDALRSPKSPSPRQRPGGPRRPTASFKATTPPTPMHFQRHTIDEAAPSYSGRTSPAFSSPTGSAPSPVASSHLSVLDELSHIPSSRVSRDQAVQAGPADAPTPPLSRVSTPAVKIIVKPPTLTPPPALNFDSTPIHWRGMPLETAQWTMSSSELQQLVSRAIRGTAQQSFIRLLPTKVLDEELKAELERLDEIKATTQAQYRFSMHRRTMLLQSVLALSSGEGDVAALTSLATQLADITAACDKYMLELLRIADHRAQIQHLQEVHVASALAMALRKLNASYAKRTTEVRESRERMEQMKAELEEAWKVAEDMAQEMDDLDNFHSGFSSEDDADDDSQRFDESVRLAEVIGITGTAVAMKATLTQLAADKAKEREKELDNARQRRVSAARKRSSRASKASLRIPKLSLRGSIAADRVSTNSRASGSSDRGRAGDTAAHAAPPMPTLKVDIASTKKKSKGDSFLEIETRPVTPATPVAPSLPPPSPVPAVPPLSSATREELHRDAVSVRSKHSTFDFEIPPIAIHPAEDISPSSSLSARRVQSMQPTPRTSLRDTALSGSSLKRTASEHKSFDVWPWDGQKHARRRSMPLAGIHSAEDLLPELRPRPSQEPRSASSPPPTHPRSPTIPPDPDPRPV